MAPREGSEGSSSPPPSGVDSGFADALARYEEALLQGQTVSWGGPLSREQAARLERAAPCLRLLADLYGQGPDNGQTDSSRPPLLPPRVGRFEVKRLLGAGGFGVVYLAWDPQMHRPVALKVPRPGALFGERARRAFLLEARAVARMDHPGIVPVYEVGAGDEEQPEYIASAYCDGPSMAEWLRDRRGPVPFRAAAAWVAQLADAVEYAHRQGVLHRDIKPGNVLLVPHQGPGGAEGLGLMPRLADFGLAKFLTGPADLAPVDGPTWEGPPGSEPPTWTRPGVRVGTLAYMAPEQSRGGAGPAADVYSLGAVLYELLTGRPPFLGRDEELMDCLASKEPAPPEELRREAPGPLSAACLRCLRKKPEARYPSAAALAEALRHWLAADRPGFSRGWPLAGLAVLLVCLAALLLAWPGEGKGPRPEPPPPARAERTAALGALPWGPIGEKGRPAQAAWAMGAGEEVRRPDGVFSVQSYGGLLQLARSVPAKKFRFEAEVFHERDDGEAGIYIGHHTERGEHLFCTWVFNDLTAKYEPVPGPRVTAARLLLFRGRGQDVNSHTATVGKELFYPRPPAPRWRRLALEVDEKGLGLWWDGKLFQSVPWAKVERTLRFMRGQPGTNNFWAGMPTSLNTRGGLGLRVKGRAAFRCVSVRPLK